MNNYCTNCGKKIKKDTIKCSECNTYIIDLKVINKEKTFHTIRKILLILLVLIILIIIIYNLYYLTLSKTIYRKYLKDEFKEAQFIGREPCRLCDGSCDGSCINSPKIIGCFKYYYKSHNNIDNSDIIVFSNKGYISIDNYSNIINKYGFKDDRYDDEFKYQTQRRSDLHIIVDNINNNITQIYKMINEIIDTYKKDTSDYIYITISEENSYDNYIDISNYKIDNKLEFKWEITRNYNDIQLLNPTLDEIKNVFTPINKPNNSLNGGYYYYD